MGTARTTTTCPVHRDCVVQIRTVPREELGDDKPLRLPYEYQRILGRQPDRAVLDITHHEIEPAPAPVSGRDQEPAQPQSYPAEATVVTAKRRHFWRRRG